MFNVKSTFFKILLYIYIIGTSSIVFFVNPRRSNFQLSDNGLSFNTSFISLDQALSAAATSTSANKLIFLVGNYTYYPNTTSRSGCFQTADRVKIYGGFIGYESGKAERPAGAIQKERYKTIISGDIGTKNNNADNCYHVITYKKRLTLDRVTITGGNANYNEINGYSNQINTLHRYGGALITSDPSPIPEILVFDEVDFINNIAINGGALWFHGDHTADIDVTITNCIFKNNRAINGEYEGGYGGAIYHYFLASITVSSSEFINNSAEFRGGAIYQDYGGQLHIEDSIFEFNTAIYGGSIFGEDRNSQTNGTKPQIFNSFFLNNSAIELGGAICWYNNIEGRLEDNDFVSNEAKYGGAIAIISSKYTLLSSYFHDNIATENSSTNNVSDVAEFEYSTMQNPDINIDLYWSEMETVYHNNINIINVYPYDTSITICYVDSDNILTSDGLSWSNAKTNIQDCLNMLNGNNNGEVWVKNGIYYPTEIPDWKIRAGKSGPNARSFSLYDNIHLYGGFNGTETNRTQRDIFNNPTYLSCNLTHINNVERYCNQILQGADNTIVDGFIFIQSGYENIMNNNNRRRLVKNSISVETVLSSTDGHVGAGLTLNSTSIIVVNSIFYNLFSQTKGGAVYCIGQQGEDIYNIKYPKFINVAFLANRANLRGGGISADVGCNFKCKYCIFDGNECAKKGGAIYLDFHSSPKIENSKFINNIALENGGGIAADGQSIVIISDTIFRNNTAVWEGAALYAGSGVTYGVENGYEIEAININISEIFGNDNSNKLLFGNTGQSNIYLWPFGKLSFSTESRTPTGFPTPEPTPSPTNDVPNFLIFLIDDFPLTKKLNETFNGPSITNSGTYLDIPTPYIDAFLDESVVFQRSYTWPKCSPSRFALLTGRSPVHSKWAIRKSLQSTTMNGADGVDVTVANSKIWSDDTEYNIPAILKADGGYRTGHVGKWHLMATMDDVYDCGSLALVPNATKYTECKEVVKSHGFNFIDAYYHENLETNEYFSHNPEWMLQQAEDFIDRSKNIGMPFFLYFAATLTHQTVSPLIALTNYSSADTPKGTLTGNDIPNINLMSTREEILNKTYSIINKTGIDGLDEAAGTIWVDDLFGNLINYLQTNNLYDNTFIIFLNDHGVGAKSLLFEQGIRTTQAIRYPKLFTTNGYILPPNFITSTVDFASIIFQLAQIDITTARPLYKLDENNNWINDVTDYIYINTQYDTQCCNNRILDMNTAHSIVTNKYKYIFIVGPALVGNNREFFNYPYANDSEQLYDLEIDPSEQINLIQNNSFAIDDILFEFRAQMWDYIQQESCLSEDIADCIVPNITYIPSNATWLPPTPPPTPFGFNCDFVVSYHHKWLRMTKFNEIQRSQAKREEAEQYYLTQQNSTAEMPYCGANFSFIQYVYNFTKEWKTANRFTLHLDMEICCLEGTSLGQDYISLMGLEGYSGNDLYTSGQPFYGDDDNVLQDEFGLKAMITICIFVTFVCICIMAIIFIVKSRKQRKQYEKELTEIRATFTVENSTTQQNITQQNTGITDTVHTAIVKSPKTQINDVEMVYMDMNQIGSKKSGRNRGLKDHTTI